MAQGPTDAMITQGRACLHWQRARAALFRARARDLRDQVAALARVADALDAEAEALLLPAGADLGVEPGAPRQPGGGVTAAGG